MVHGHPNIGEIMPEMTRRLESGDLVLPEIAAVFPLERAAQLDKGEAPWTTATGLVAILVGLYVQMISATREQRVLIVTGMIAGFVGLALGLSRGGFVA